MTEPSVGAVSFADQAWAALEVGPPEPIDRFDPGTLSSLPDPAQRFLEAAIPAGTPLARAVELEMEGHIKLVGHWFPFTARQILRAGVGFVWAPVVGGRVVRFVGADALGAEGAQMEFRLHGRIPIVRARGADVARSAAGRLAAETVAWLPQALAPQAGASWAEGDEHHCTVTLPGPSGLTEVEVRIDPVGQLRSLRVMRWNNSLQPPAEAPFGGAISTVHVANGVHIAGRGVVGWDWDARREHGSEFFGYTITDARFL